MRNSIFILLFIITPFIVAAQADDEKKKFISAIEIFAGPNASFNYGNKFIENYEDENVTNKRLLKLGYVAGVGVYHPISNRIDLNIRLQYETKGTKNELDVPRVTDDTRVIISSEYTFRYFTLTAISQIKIGNKIKLGIGGYISKFSDLKGYEKTYFTRESEVFSEGEFDMRVFRKLDYNGGIQSISIMRTFYSMEPYDYGISFYFEYAVSIKANQHLYIQSLNMLGIQNINRNNSFDLQERNSIWSLTIAYKINRE